jgi:hypothetical protein
LAAGWRAAVALVGAAAGLVAVTVVVAAAAADDWRTCIPLEWHSGKPRNDTAQSATVAC